jgi:hypothetical protein
MVQPNPQLVDPPKKTLQQIETPAGRVLSERHLKPRATKKIGRCAKWSMEPKLEAQKIQARALTGKPRPRAEIWASCTEEPKQTHRTRQEQWETEPSGAGGESTQSTLPSPVTARIDCKREIFSWGKKPGQHLCARSENRRTDRCTTFWYGGSHSEARAWDQCQGHHLQQERTRQTKSDWRKSCRIKAEQGF